MSNKTPVNIQTLFKKNKKNGSQEKKKYYKQAEEDNQQFNNVSMERCNSLLFLFSLSLTYS